MADVRNFKLPAVWAKNAYTTIPTPPVVNLAYRNENLSADEIEQGQLYGALGNSADWNQMLWLLSALANEGQQQGILSWSPLIDYAVGAWVMGTNGNAYTALKASGPATEIVNPATEEESEDMTWLDVTAKLQGGSSGGIAGMVVPFSGSFGGAENRHPIPRGSDTPDTHWVLCDGGSDGNGGTVPDLRGRFILGASDSHPMGETGGAETHTHSLSGTVEDTTLTVAQMPKHKHRHQGRNGVVAGSGVYVVPNAKLSGESMYTGPQEETGSSSSHNHSLSGNTEAGSSLPSYYALSYIMKIA